MNMHGVDRIIPAIAGAPVAEMFLRACRRQWPESVVWIVDEDENLSINAPELWSRLSHVREFFVYRNDEAAWTWDDHGWTKAFADSMLHFMPEEADAESDQFCVVEDYSESNPLVERILGDLTDELIEPSST